MQKTYTQEFKREAVRLAQSSGKSIAQVARELGISDSSIHQWRKELAEHGTEAFPGSGHQTALEEENRRLKRELERTRQERDILKKTRTALFSGKTAPPEHVSSVLDLSESDVVHVELHDDSQSVFGAFATLQADEEPNQNR